MVGACVGELVGSTGAVVGNGVVGLAVGAGVNGKHEFGASSTVQYSPISHISQIEEQTHWVVVLVAPVGSTHVGLEEHHPLLTSQY